MRKKSRRRIVNVFVNGTYVYSSDIYRNCKEAVKDLKQRKSMLVAAIEEKEDYVLRLNPTDEITACPARAQKDVSIIF